MIEIQKAYLQNSKMELINQLYNQGNLIEVLEKFFKELYWTTNVKSVRIYKKQKSCINVSVDTGDKWHSATESYEITDYSCWLISKRRDYTETLLRFFSARLQGKAKAKYLVGLGEFSKKVAADIENQLLNASQVEMVEDVIDLQPKKRLIEQQIKQNETSIDEKIDAVVKANMKYYNELDAKGKTTVIKPEITEEEIKEAIASARRHDIEHGQLL